ncbi:MAG: YqeG family HAD IIIA-type phosphatase [Lachnospiraceae bacterium]|nr:YqeG family HAD IIIA-type phosphatase [Lachnospiraceae bacterium]
MAVNKKKENLSRFGLLVVAIIWGLAFVVVKNSLDYISPVYMLAFRFTIAGVVLGVIFIKKIIGAGSDTIKHGIFIGIFLFLAYLSQTVGIKYTTAGNNAFLTAFYVILVPFLHWIRTKVKPTLNCFIAAVLALVAIGVISLNGMNGINIGDLLTIICAVFYSFQIDLIGHYSRKDDPVVLACIQLLTTAILSWLIAPFAEGSISDLVFNKESVTGLLFLGLMSSMLCFLLQSLCQKYVRSSQAALLMSTESVFGALSGALLLNEAVGGRLLFGFILMFVAVLLALIEPSSFEMLYPDETVSSAYDIDYEGLYEKGYRGIIFDIDNTLVMHDAHGDERSRALFERLKTIGYKAMILSNNDEERVTSFMKEVGGEYCIHKAGKPKRSGYNDALKMMGTDRSNTFSVGDQLFTDVWGSKNAGIHIILTEPVNVKEKFHIILKRKLERIVLYFYGFYLDELKEQEING